jgi:hypothetical protein
MRPRRPICCQLYVLRCRKARPIRCSAPLPLNRLVPKSSRTASSGTSRPANPASIHPDVCPPGQGNASMSASTPNQYAILYVTPAWPRRMRACTPGANPPGKQWLPVPRLKTEGVSKPLCGGCFATDYPGCGFGQSYCPPPFPVPKHLCRCR